MCTYLATRPTYKHNNQHIDKRINQHNDKRNNQDNDKRSNQHNDKRNNQHNDKRNNQHNDKRNNQHNDKRNSQHNELSIYYEYMYNCLKLPVCFKLINFLERNLINYLTYIIKKAYYEGICVEFESKTSQHCFFYFQIACKYWKYFMTNPLNIIFLRFLYLRTRL